MNERRTDKEKFNRTIKLIVDDVANGKIESGAHYARLASVSVGRFWRYENLAWCALAKLPRPKKIRTALYHC